MLKLPPVVNSTGGFLFLYYGPQTKDGQKMNALHKGLPTMQQISFKPALRYAPFAILVFLFFLASCGGQYLEYTDLDNPDPPFASDSGLFTGKGGKVTLYKGKIFDGELFPGDDTKEIKSAP
jgi:hypothetical protein